MFVVVMTALGSPIEAEAQALAAELGSTAYEERLNLTGGLPAVLRCVPEREQAVKLLRGVRERGSSAVGFDRAAVVAHDAMPAFKQFRFEVDSSRTISRVRTETDELPATDILAMVHAIHKSRTEERVEVKEKKFSLGRAVASGGLLMRKSVTTERKEISVGDEQVLYVFRASGAPPWLLRERGTGYAGLGSELSPSSTQNFQTTIRWLRKLAPTAVFDDRLSRPRGFGGRASPLLTQGTDTAPLIDVLAHALALASTRSG